MKPVRNFTIAELVQYVCDISLYPVREVITSLERFNYHSHQFTPFHYLCAISLGKRCPTVW